MAWALWIFFILFTAVPAEADSQGRGGNSSVSAMAMHVFLPGNSIIEIPANARDGILLSVVGGSRPLSYPSSGSSVLLKPLENRDQVLMICGERAVQCSYPAADLHDWQVTDVPPRLMLFLRSALGFFLHSWMGQVKENIPVSVVIATHNLRQLFTVQMVASIISLVLIALTLLRRFCKRPAILAALDMVVDFIAKVMFMTEMAVAVALILAVAFLRLCKRRLAIAILMTALVLVVVLDFVRVPAKILTMTLILIMTGLSLALAFLRVYFLRVSERLMIMMLLTALGMVVAFQVVSTRFEMMLILNTRLALGFLYRLPMMVILKTRLGVDLAVGFLYRLGMTVILKAKRALDFLDRLRMMMILMTKLALVLGLGFLTVSRRRTVMVILMTSAAMAVTFLKVSNRIRRMVILTTRLVLGVAFLDKFIRMLILMTRVAVAFLRISRRYTRMAILITGLAVAVGILKVSKKPRMIVVILLAPTLLVTVLLFSHLFLPVSFHMHLYFQLQML